MNSFPLLTMDPFYSGENKTWRGGKGKIILLQHEKEDKEKLSLLGMTRGD
jgi:hypothetical protein